MATKTIRTTTSAVLLAALAVASGCGTGDEPAKLSAASSTAKPKPSVAAALRSDGPIVYAQEVGGDFELFSVAADGTGTRRLTHVDGDAVQPDWSPDGKRIVFEIDHKHAKPHAYCSIALMNADGSGLTDLAVTGHDCNNQPSFAPDGQRIVFVHYDAAKDKERVATMDLDGGDRRDVSLPWRNGVTDPNTSPDGKWITFVRLPKKDGEQALFAMRPDGSELHRLTPASWGVAVKHDWSPDGELILVSTHAHLVQPGESANVVTLHPDGSVATRLTHFSGGKKHAYAGSFSPDGKRIVFRLEQGDKYSLATVDRDGGNLQPLTELSADRPRFIDWGTGPAGLKAPGPSQPQAPKPAPEAVSGGGED